MNPGGRRTQTNGEEKKDRKTWNGALGGSKSLPER
jgi:hypothetical protein